MVKITILLLGTEESPLLPSLMAIENLKFEIICNNVLDFELPPKVENAAPIWHRHELRNVLKQMGADNFQISSSLKNLLQENDILELSDEYLGVTSHISQIEQNSKDLFIAYDLLLEQTNSKNIELTPLVNPSNPLFAIKNKRVGPLRYYQLEQKLLDLPYPESVEKKKINPKELFVANREILDELRLSEPANHAMHESDLIIILPTDIVSLSVLVSAKEMENQIKNIQTPLVLLWPFESDPDEEENKIVKEISENLGFGLEIGDFAGNLSSLTDYVIINKQEKEQLAVLREFGCHVLTSEFFDENGEVEETLLQTILRVASLEKYLPDEADENGTHRENSKESQQTQDDIIDLDEKTDRIDEETPVTGKKISQLTESPEEAGIERLKEKVMLDEPETESDALNDILDDISKRESEINEKAKSLAKTVENSTNSANEELPPKKEEEIRDSLQTTTNGEQTGTFQVREEEDWIDTTKRAIEQLFVENHEEALEWLVSQSGDDSDREMQIAELAINAWIDSRSTPDRKLGAEIISRLSKNHRETYVQILQRQMVLAVREMQEDRRRLLIPLFLLIRDVDLTLSEQLTRAITKDLGIIGGEDEISVIETAKLTLLQLVISSRRLTRISIQELLNILDTRPSIGPEIWNILVAFDAGSISIELVTNFSISKAEEIIRRSNLLRFTGSYYSTITKVIQAWKEGDKAAISSATGSILPEETLRKFERLELARKVDKLKMVQLTTLAESLGKDNETVERLITELIVNDELKAEMKLIDGKMYLVAITDQVENS